MGRFTNDSGGGGYTPPPVGTHLARCFKIVDIGTQIGEWNNKPTAHNKIIVSWELPTELDDEGKPITTSRFYTNLLSDKANLRLDLQNWRGRDFTREELDKFDLENILGKPCLLTIVAKNDKTKVAGVSGLPKGMECPAQVNPSFAFWIENFDREKFDSLSDKIQAMIKSSPEYDTVVNGGAGDDTRPDEPGDDVPF